jgi:CheY-like chemotaxis protein
VALRPVIGYLLPHRTLLVVDDQPLQRQLLAAMLVPLGFTVREAASGQECLEIVQNTPPDLVLLDLTMDDLDGWRTAEMLRALPCGADIPIVFVSANLFDNQPARLAALRCQGFVGKPVAESELLDALEHALQLEWVYDNTPLIAANGTPLAPHPAAHAPKRCTPQDMMALPESLREDLVRLAQQGQASALRQLLHRALQEWPAHAAALRQLKTCADQFDLQALARHLREPDHDAQP